MACEDACGAFSNGVDRYDRFDWWGFQVALMLLSCIRAGLAPVVTLVLPSPFVLFIFPHP
jgi:hypothetical protein